MKIHFLGTGTSQGVPVIGCDCEVCQSQDKRDTRLRTSILIQTDHLNLVVDVGPDFRQQMLQTGIQKLDAVLITHEHNDHIIGMDDIRPFNFRSGKDLPVYASDRVQKELRQRFSYIFDTNPYPGAPQVELCSINKEESFQIENITILPIEVIHGKMPVLGFRINNFTYITDAKTIEAKELEKIKGTEVLVLNALIQKEHHSHLNLLQALDIIDLIQPKQAYLTHVSHRMGKTSEVEQLLPNNVSFAYDGLEIQI